MRLLRACYRLIFGCCLTILYFSTLGVWRRFASDPMAWRNQMVKRWGKVMCRIAKCNVTLEGVPPEAPFVLVCNHLSYVDIPILLAYVDAVPIAKKEIRSWPIIGFICAGVDVIFVDRTRRRDVVRVNDAIAEQVNDRQGLLFFPEGRISDGTGVLPFKPSLLAFPASQKMPVYYASLTYSTPPGEPLARDVVCWWHSDQPLMRHILQLLHLPGFQARLSFGPCAIVNEDRKELASVLWQKVTEQYVPVDSEDNL